jgi:uncharacterized protein YukE
MTTPQHFQVEPEQIRAHAKTVDDVSAQLSHAAGGLSNGLADNALGPFTQFLTTALQNAINQTTQAMTHASSGVGSVGAGLRKTADSYQETDEHSAARLSTEGDQ